MEYFIGFIVLLGALIFIHEFGHFIVAKLANVKVLKFSLGFPPAMVKRKWGETEYILSWIPLGGYVKLFGEDPESDEEIPPEEKHRAFTSKSLLARMAIVAAGPLSNYLMAMILLCAAFALGWLAGPANIGKVFDNTPAMEAGLQSGDKVLAVDGKPVTRWDAMRRIIEKSAGKTLTLTVQRDEEKLDLSVTPRASEQDSAAGRSVGRIGVMPIRLGFFASLYEGVRFTFHLTGLILETLVKLARLEVSAKELAGPITIAQASGESLKAGLFSFIFLMAFISINLAIINLLPIPILDGGHLMFFLIEAVIRRPVTGKVREIATQAGLLFLILLMVLVFYNDISRIMVQGWSLRP